MDPWWYNFFDFKDWGWRSDSHKNLWQTSHKSRIGSHQKSKAKMSKHRQSIKKMKV